MDMDDAYANGAYIAGAETYPERWAEEALRFRKTALAELDVVYGPTTRQKLDVFHPPRLARGTLIFVHGGYWRAFDKSHWSHLAQGAIARGWSVAMPSYDLCPNVGISDITLQIASALKLVSQKYVGPIALAGHSAGGHLVARMLDRRIGHGCHQRIVSAVPISPLSDLRPLMQTALNDDLQLDANEAQAESPIVQPAPVCPVTVWVGGDERPAFLDQATWLSEAWNVDRVVQDGRHHFDVIDDLVDADSALLDRLLPS